MAPRLEAEATAAKDAQAALAVMRCQLMDIRALVLRSLGESPITIEAARLLRRKPNADALTSMIERLTTALDTEDMSVSDDENERHIQDDQNYSPSPAPRPLKQDTEISIEQTLEHCRAWQTYFPKKPSTWSDVAQISDQIAPMIGIAPEAMNKARGTFDRASLSVVILCLLERFDRIENVGNYLQTVVDQASVGRFRLEKFLKGSNRRNCQLTI